MSRFNHYFQNQFAGCVVLAMGRDEARGRDVRIVALPGEFTVVGLCDGTDAWVAPVNAIGSPLLARAKMIMDEIRAGKDPKPAHTRRKLQLDPDPPPEPATRPRARLLIEDPAPTPRARRTLNV